MLKQLPKFLLMLMTSFCIASCQNVYILHSNISDSILDEFLFGGKSTITRFNENKIYIVEEDIPNGGKKREAYIKANVKFEICSSQPVIYLTKSRNYWKTDVIWAIGKNRKYKNKKYVEMELYVGIDEDLADSMQLYPALGENITWTSIFISPETFPLTEWSNNKRRLAATRPLYYESKSQDADITYRGYGLTSMLDKPSKAKANVLAPAVFYLVDVPLTLLGSIICTIFGNLYDGINYLIAHK